MGPGPVPSEAGAGPRPLEGISAVTLATHDMARAVRFYQALGFTLCQGGEGPSFTSLQAGACFLNLLSQPAGRSWSWWGRVIFRVADVDALHRRALAAGLRAEGAPRDAPWGERYFHLTDPDGHELSFAQPMGRGGLGPGEAGP
jgi:catechol 2,3-dioxygenase-like lactoylglutathione lyase family enzyme